MLSFLLTLLLLLCIIALSLGSRAARQWERWRRAARFHKQTQWLREFPYTAEECRVLLRFAPQGVPLTDAIADQILRQLKVRP